jgi:hypothetical protein
MSARIQVVDDEPDLEALVLQKFRQQIRHGTVDTSASAISSATNACTLSPCVRAAKKNGPHEKLTPRASSGFFLRPNNVHTGSDCDDCHYDEYDDLERFRVHLSLHYEWNGFLKSKDQGGSGSIQDFYVRAVTGRREVPA